MTSGRTSGPRSGSAPSGGPQSGSAPSGSAHPAEPDFGRPERGGADTGSPSDPGADPGRGGAAAAASRTGVPAGIRLHDAGRGASARGRSAGHPRHGAARRPAPDVGRGTDDRLLDAARDCVLAVGLRRTTLTDVARRAGVSRMTMYRRWPDMSTLMADLMTREWSALAVTAAAEAVGETVRERVVDTIVRGVRSLREHPMFRRVVELDPDVLMPYLVDRRGSMQDAILTQLVATVRAPSDGSLRAGDPELLVRTVLLSVHGFVLSSATMTDRVTGQALDDELRLLLDRYLRPGEPPR